MFFKKRRPSVPFEPDLTKIKLYNGDYYHLFDNSLPVYTLCEWDEDWDSDFPELAMECALAIMDDYPIVVNCLCPSWVGMNVHDENQVKEYLQSIDGVDFGHPTHHAITLTNGPDRGLIASFDHDDEWFQMYFYGYHQLPRSTPPTTSAAPDVTLYFKHSHSCLTIASKNSIDVYADKIRPICEKYGKTLVIQEPLRRENK